MATKPMIDEMREMAREESLAAAGWRRQDLKSFVGTGTICACFRCGKLPHAYSSADGMYGLACTSCGAGTEDSKTAAKAVAAWDKDNKGGTVWRSTNDGFTDAGGRKAWEQISYNGTLETVYK